MFAIAGIALATAIPGFLAGVWLHEESTIEYKRGSPTEEFVTTQKAKAPEAPRPRRVVLRLPWPTYGLRVQRTHTSEDFKLRPPFRLRWTFKAGHVLEFPPSIAYGRLYFAQQRGRFFAIHHRTGKVVWQRRFNHCSAASPTIAYRVVYHSWMQPLPCNRFPRNQPGQVVAMAARTGKIVWRYRAGVFESSPLVVGQDALRRIVGPQAPCGQHLHRQGPLDVHRGRRGQQLAGVRERKGLLRNGRRQRLRAGRPHGPPSLARSSALPLRAPRVLLRHADDRVRPRVRREHRRHALRLRRLERQAAVGPARRQLHLHGGRGLAAAGLHRHVRRSVHGVQRGDRGPAVALPGLVRDPRSAERHRRSRLLRRLPPLWPQRLPVVQERRPRHLRLERTHREARLALARRSLQSRHRRQPASLHRRALARLQLCTEESSRSA